LPWTLWVVIASYLVYLTPYVIVSYYDRYDFPLICLNTLLVVGAGSQLIRLFTARRPPAEEEESIPMLELVEE
jgi:hypothetical protein